MKECLVQLANAWASCTHCFISLSRLLDNDKNNTISCCERCESHCCSFVVAGKHNRVIQATHRLSNKLRVMQHELSKDIDKMNLQQQLGEDWKRQKTA